MMLRNGTLLGISGSLLLGIAAASGCGGETLDADDSGQVDNGGAAAQASGQLPRLGWKPDSRELVAARRLTSGSGLLAGAALPTSADLTSKLPAPGDQGSQGSCVGWATGFATKSFDEAVEMNWSPSTPSHRFSPSWIYNQINGGVDKGAYISDALNLIVSKGADTIDQFPYTATNFTRQPDAASFTRAVPYRARSWHTLPVTTTDFKNVLAGGNVIVAGLQVMPDMDAMNATTNTVYDSDAGESRGGHAIAIIGYDDSKGAFKFINSWGPTNWGMGGYGWLAYSMLSSVKLHLDAYVLIDAPNHARVRPQDYDGDGYDDLIVYRASSGTWYVHPGKGGADIAMQFGASTDIPVPGDYDGDGKTDWAVYRPSNGTWYVRPTTGGGDRVMQFGASTDIPVPGDYDGDGRADYAVYRPASGAWYYRPMKGGADVYTPFGASTDVPVPGDYDGDGKTDVAVYRPANGTWYVHKSTGGADLVTQFGAATDRPIPGDYDGDGKTDAAVYRPANGTWYAHKSTGGADMVQQFGAATDRAVPGDYDGDGKTDVAVYRPANGTWYYHPTKGGADVVTQFGMASDVIPYSR